MPALTMPCRSCVAVVAAAACLLGLPACTTPSGGGRNMGEIDVHRVKTHDDITAVYCFYARDPWLRDNDGIVIGFKASVYFHSAATERGAFVPGKILVWLYTVERQPDGRYAREFVHGWEMDEKEAMRWRVRYERKLGNQYGFPLRWPPGIDLVNQQVEIVFGYERLDGRVIEGTPRRFRVPIPIGYRQPSSSAAQPVQPRVAPESATPDVPPARPEP